MESPCRKRRGDIVVQGREVNDGVPRPRSLVDEEETVVEARRLRGWFYCPLPKKGLKFLG